MQKFSSKIFIDGGIPSETRQANEILKKSLGRPLDGQTTNPTLIAKNLKEKITMKTSDLNAGGVREGLPIVDVSKSGIPERQDPQIKMKKPVKLTPDLALSEYKQIVGEMSTIIPQGSISIQVFANLSTKAEEMLKQARARHTWISNSSIKLPCTKEGLKAAEIVCREFPINITLVFSQSQAAAVYEATKGAKYPVFISPFVGRLDDKGENGMDVVKNIMRMFNEYAPSRRTSGRRVEVLTASVRNLDHIYYGLQLKSNIITIPFKVFKEWADLEFSTPESHFHLLTGDAREASKTKMYRSFGSPSSRTRKLKSVSEYIYPARNLKPIPYRSDELTDKGVTAFWSDWNGLFS